MSTTLTINGVAFAYPDTGDQNWGTEASGWAAAVTSGMLQKAGGTFTLTADVNFGATFGLFAKYFTSVTANPSATGVLRLANADGIGWRNSGNSADFLLKPDANGFLQYNSIDLVNLSGTQTLTNKSMSGSANTFTNIPYSALVLTNLIVNADINSAAAIAYSKLNLALGIVNGDISASAAIAFSKLASLTSAHILVGSAGNVATDVAVSGDISLTNAGVTAYAGTVPLNKGGTGTAAASANAAFNVLSPLTTKGDLLGFSTVNARLAIGTDGFALIADAASTLGFKWAAILSNPMTTLGDIIYEDVTPAAVRLAGNTTSTKKFLTQTGTGAVSAAPAWGTVANTDLSGITNTQLSGSAAISNANLATMINNTVKGNTSGGTTTPSDLALTVLATAATVMYRDSNANSLLNNLALNFGTTVTAAGTTTLSVASGAIQQFTGTTTQIVVLPNATTLVTGFQFQVFNRSTGSVTINKNGGGGLGVMVGGTQAVLTCTDVSTAAGVWDIVYTATGALPIGMGGTAATTKAGAFDSLSPMTTGGDVIYGGASGTGTRLANGSAGQVLQSAGGTSAPTWANHPTASYASATFSSASSWTTTSTSFVDPTNAGGNALTSIYASGITLTAAGSNVCGITFTPASSSAVYLVMATVGLYNNTGSDSTYVQMTDGTTAFAVSFGISNPTAVTGFYPTTLQGVYAPGTGSPVTVKLQIAVNAGTGGITGALNSSAKSFPVQWSVVRIL